MATTQENLSISGNFQQLWVELAVKLPPPRAKQAKFLDWIYSFQAISSNFTFNCQLSSPPRGQTGKNFRLDLSISGNFQQLWVQLAVKPSPSPGAKQGQSLDWIYSFQAISGNFGCNWQKTP